MSSDTITLDIYDGAAIITLNRPDVLNSFNDEMGSAFQSALARVKDESEIRAVLLTGAGRAFCAGQDLAEVVSDGAPSGDLGAIVRDRYNPIIKAIRCTEKPFVCAVNGVAAGAGANLAFACDIVLASEKASFIQSFANIGLIPDSGGTYFLPRLIGMQRATALAMLAEKVSATNALEMGLIYKTFTPDTLMEEALSMAKKLATQPTAGLGLIKRGLNASLSNDLEAQLTLEEDLQRTAGETSDYIEGVSAFLQKRSPVFTGK